MDDVSIEPNSRDLIAGLEKGLAVIAVFDRERRRLTMTEVATLCGLTRAAARRYLITLESLGYVMCERRMYSLTPKVLRLSQSYMHSARLPRAIEPELHRLAREVKEASSAGVLDGDDVICIAATMAGRAVSQTLQPGTRVPAHCTANGRVLVAGLRPEEAEAWIARQHLSPVTARTIVDTDRLRDEIARTRERGWCAVDQELEDGLRTLSVPLCNHAGDTVAALNLSVHAARFSMNDLVQQYLPWLQQAQARLRRSL
jgi:IclR family pca regulon transcriptional regulator